MVQRYLCSKTTRQAASRCSQRRRRVRAVRALPADRSMLYVYYTGMRRPRWRRSRWTVASRGPDLSALHRQPPAAAWWARRRRVFAAAMSTLSSSLNSSSATAMADFYMPLRKASDDTTCGLAVADSVLGRRADLVALSRSSSPRAWSTSAGHRLLHQRHHPRRVPARTFAPGVRQRRRRGHRGRHSGHAGRQDLRLTSWQWYVLVARW